MKKRILISITIIVCISILFITAFLLYKRDNTLNLVENETADITEFTIYGTHLNMKGKININNVNSINLVLKNSKKEIEYNLEYKKKDNQIFFYISNNINEGINLENIDKGKYYVLLKIDNKYYTLNNDTSYNDLKYYSINDRTLNIYSAKEKSIPYFKIEVKNQKTPDDVYDIVIDAGHGGNDTGAINGENKESFYTLEYALSLKESLEKMGYKVKMTRESDTYLSPYGENGRAIIPQDVKAKYLISLHLNSIAIKGNIHGVEVYAPYNTNLDFASSLAKNIVEIADTQYSNNTHYKVQNGVYIRTLTEDDVISTKENVKEYDYDLENISTNTNYLFILRETGGIMTGAYITNNISQYGDNKYYNSNIGVESYLIELGYIIDNKDLTNIQNNKEKYIEAISKAIDEEIKKVN